MSPDIGNPVNDRSAGSAARPGPALASSTGHLRLRCVRDA